MQESLTDEGRFKTANASRYLQQLCKHFVHKIEVRLDQYKGELMVPLSPISLTAKDDELVVTLTSDNADRLEKSRGVIDSHLERFAFKEGLKGMDWSVNGV